MRKNWQKIHSSIYENCGGSHSASSTMGRKADFWLWQRSKSEEGSHHLQAVNTSPALLPCHRVKRIKIPISICPSGPGKRRERWTLPPEAPPATSSHTYFPCRMKGNSFGAIIFGQPTWDSGSITKPLFPVDRSAARESGDLGSSQLCRSLAGWPGTSLCVSVSPSEKWRHSGGLARTHTGYTCHPSGFRLYSRHC